MMACSYLVGREESEHTLMHSNLQDTALLSTKAFHFVGIEPACTSEASRAWSVFTSRNSSNPLRELVTSDHRSVGLVTASHEKIAMVNFIVRCPPEPLSSMSTLGLREGGNSCRNVKGLEP